MAVLSSSALEELVESGLPTVGKVRWGSHLCHFYRSADDLVGALVPYFRKGLEAGERCLWITSEPLRSACARELLSREVPALAEYERRGQIDILDFQEWYRRHGQLSTESVLEAWLNLEEEALESGLNGLRITGNTFWLERKDWADFAAYEAAVHDQFRGRRVLALCSYSLDRCGIDDVLDVLHNHQFALLRRSGSWEIVRSATQLLGVMEQSGLGTPSELYAASPDAAERRAALHLASLQRVTASLAEAKTREEVQHVIESELRSALGASRVLVVSPDSNGKLCPVGIAGIPNDVIASDQPSPPDAIRPSAEVYGSGNALWMHDAGEVAQRYPELPTKAVAIACVALSAGGRRLGAASFGFAEPQSFDGPQRALIEDISYQLGMTLERVQLYEDLERQRRQAVEASRSKDEFLAMLGHELRNPLAAIRSASELLSLKHDLESIEHAQSVLERQSLQMSKLVDGLLNVSRIIRGKIVLDRAELELTHILKDTLEDRMGEIEHKGIQLVADLEQPLQVRADRVRMVQVFDNLLSNAIKFTPAGGQIRVSGHAENGSAIVAVRDTGEGIDNKLVESIFEPFRQAAQGLARTSGGLGLGLAVVKGMVELHGGRVSVHSNGAGTGSEFRVSIPSIPAH